MNRKQWISISIGLVLMIAGSVAWAMWPREAPEVKQAQELANKMFAEETTDEQRTELREQMRELRDNVPEEKRSEVFRAMGDQFRQRMTAHIREFSTLPEEERQEFLDRDIDRMEQMRKGFEQQRRERDGGERDRGQAGAGQRGGPGGPPGGRPRTEEEREQRRRARLDNTTPEDRAHFVAYMQAINARRAERGLEPMRRPGRGPGRRGSSHQG